MIIVKNIFTGKNYVWPTHSNALLLDRKSTRGSEAFLTAIKPGKFTHEHVHKDNEQVYYVIEGKGVIFSRLANKGSKKKVKINKFDLVLIPLKVYHQVFCTGKKSLRYLTIDIFPKGKPKDEPTWETHARKLALDTKQK